MSKRLLRADDIDRTVLLALHDDSQPTLEAALTAHARTGVVLCADATTCSEAIGQAALITGVVTAVRAFGNVVVLAAVPEAPIAAGVFRGLTIADAIAREGARAVAAHDLEGLADGWPVVLFGAETPIPEVFGTRVRPRTILRASWSAWMAKVHASTAPATEPRTGSCCALAAVAAGAMGISEAFGSLRARPGSDAGFRTVALNLWDPGGDTGDHGPALGYAPLAWWLVGLGHLGQAYCWVISWLTYLEPSAVEVVLQDTDRTTPANHSTGVLTPEGSDGVYKTRLAAEALEHAGFTTRILERRLGPDLRAAPSECHVALLGVDNLPTRVLTSDVRWLFAVDVGLGSGADNFSSLLLRRFPGAKRSDEITPWTEASQSPVGVRTSAAFTNLEKRYEVCGVVELAGKAVGASFVGIAAACIAVAEVARELHGGKALDVLTLDLSSWDSASATATPTANVISAELLVPAAQS